MFVHKTPPEPRNPGRSRAKGHNETAARPWRTGLAAAALFALVLSAYAPVFRAGFIWDDHGHVLEDATLRSFDGLARIWLQPGATQQYYPLVYTVFWLEYHLWGLQPAGYHVTNVLLHGLVAVLVWRVLRRLELRAAWGIAAIFALHPVHVESAAWISEHKNTLSAICGLLAVLAYLRFCPAGPPDPAPRGRWRWYVLALACFLAALLCKSVTVTLPAALLVLTWWHRGRLTWPDVRPLLPFLAIGLAIGPFSMQIERGYIAGDPLVAEDWQLSPLHRILVAGRALWFYIAKLLWPAELVFCYDRWTVDSTRAWQWAFPIAAVLAMAAAAALRKQLGRGPLAALLLFAGTLAPALGFVNYYPMRYSYVADHFQYFASVPMLVLLVSAARVLVARGAPRARSAAPVALAALLLTLGIRTWNQAHIYTDRETLWRDTVIHRPRCLIALNNLGLELYRQHRITDAVPYLERALELRPACREIRANLANSYGSLGRNDDALQLQLEWLQGHPDDAVFHHNAAVTLYFGLQRPTEALGHVSRTLALDPDYAKARQLREWILAGGLPNSTSAPTPASP